MGYRFLDWLLGGVGGSTGMLVCSAHTYMYACLHMQKDKNTLLSVYVIYSGGDSSVVRVPDL